MTGRNPERDAEICNMYQAGFSITACAEKYGIGRQRAQQILKRAGVWRPAERSTGRPKKFLGVHVHEDTHAALKRKAVEEGLSVSRVTSDALDELVKTP